MDSIEKRLTRFDVVRLVNVFQSERLYMRERECYR